MTMPFNEFRYIYPPRPASKIPFDPTSPVFKAWAKQSDSLAQLKLNGSRSLVYIDPDDNVQMWNRHNELHRSYIPSPELIKKIKALPYPKGFWNVFDSELMHLKTPTVKNTVYFYDTLVWGGEYLIGKPYTERYLHVRNFGLPSYPIERKAIQGELFTAQNFVPADWAEVWKAIQSNEVLEGLVIKRAGTISNLQTGNREENNGSWMVRVRKPHKNYQF